MNTFKKGLIINPSERKRITLVIFVDFIKAFDHVNHSIVVKKLEHYRIRGIVARLVKTYLMHLRLFFLTMPRPIYLYKNIRSGRAFGGISVFSRTNTILGDFKRFQRE